MEQNHSQPHPHQINQSQPSAAAQPTLQPHPQLINPSQPIQQPFPQQSHQIIQQHSSQSQPNVYPHSQIQSSSHLLLPSAQGQAGWVTNAIDQLQGIVPPQYASTNVLRGDLQSGSSSSQMVSQRVDDVICIDSDSDTEGADGSSGVVSNNHTPFPNTQISSSSNVLPVAPIQSSIPIAMVAPVLSHTSNNKMVQSKSRAPSEAAVTNALAGFVQFQKDMCKDLSQNSDGIGPAKLALNSLANTLNVFNRTDHSTTDGLNQLPVVGNNAGCHGDAPVNRTTSDSPLSNLITSLQENEQHQSDSNDTRVSAIVNPINYKQPTP